MLRASARQSDGVFTASTRVVRVATPARRSGGIMFTLLRSGSRLAGVVACSCLCAASAACAAQGIADTDASSGDTPCRFVTGQAQIDGVMQPISGRACPQPDGSWQIVEGDPAPQALADAPIYYYDPWYWGPPIFFGAGVSVVFIDRFRHFHHMDHVRYVHGPHGGYGSYGSAGMGGRGGMRGGASMHGFGGMSHGGGGGMRR